MANLMILLPACRIPTKKVRPAASDLASIQRYELPDHLPCPLHSYDGFSGDRIRPRSSRRSPVGVVALLLTVLLGTPHLEAEAGGQNILHELNRSIALLTERVTPDVVQIQSTSYAPASRGPGAAAVALRPTMGSGVIWSSDGLIVTNAHVVAGADRVQVRLASAAGAPGGSVLPPRGRRLLAEIVGMDLETDLALLRVDAAGLPALEFTDSEQIRQGQIVLALGSPLELENSVRMGVVNSVARQLEPDDRMIYIQTDAPINPGNSGGPLVDVDGHVIGINTMILSQGGGSDGVGLAVPSNIVLSVVEQLRDQGIFARGEIGVEAQTITPPLAAGLSLGREYGVLLADVYPGGSAYDAGLRVGDIVLALNGKPMENARQFYVNIYAYVANRVVNLEVLRGDRQLSTSVAVRVRSDNPERVAGMFDKEQRLVARLGILAVVVDEEVSRLLPVLRRPGGIFVTRLAASTRAPTGLFLPGDIIYSVNGKYVETLDELSMIIDEYESGDVVVLQIERGGRLSFIEVELD